MPTKHEGPGNSAALGRILQAPNFVALAVASFHSDRCGRMCVGRKVNWLSLDFVLESREGLVLPAS